MWQDNTMNKQTSRISKAKRELLLQPQSILKPTDVTQDGKNQQTKPQTLLKFTERITEQFKTNLIQNRKNSINTHKKTYSPLMS